MAGLSEHTRIGLDDRAGWQAALRDIPHGFAHTWEWCRAMAASSEGATFLYEYRHGDTRVVCPLSERSWQGTIDIVTPYGFSGFAGNGDCPGFAEAFHAFARQRGYVCGYIGLNPLFTNRTHLAPGDVHTQNTLYLLDLSQSVSDLFANLSAGRKGQLRDWEAVRTSLDEDRDSAAGFLIENLAGFLEHKGAGGVYAFSDQTLAALVSSEDVLLVGARRGGELVAVSVFAHTPHAADYLFNVSTPAGRDFAAALVWFGVRRLKRMAVPWLNLGGGIRPDDGVARFKRYFGGERAPLECLKQVYRPEPYERLCRQAGVDPLDRTGYFPPFRRTAGDEMQRERGAT